MATVIEAVAGRTAPHKKMGFDGLGPGNVRTVLEVAERVQASSPRPKAAVVALEELLRGAVTIGTASDLHMTPPRRASRHLPRRGHPLRGRVLHDGPGAPHHDARQGARPPGHLREGDPRMAVCARPWTENVRSRLASRRCPRTDIGERVVLRLVRGTRSVPEVTELGGSPAVSDGLQILLSRPQGCSSSRAPSAVARR